MFKNSFKKLLESLVMLPYYRYDKVQGLALIIQHWCMNLLCANPGNGFESSRAHKNSRVKVCLYDIPKKLPFKYDFSA